MIQRPYAFIAIILLFQAVFSCAVQRELNLPNKTGARSIAVRSAGQGDSVRYQRRALHYFIDGVISEMTGDALEAAIYYEAARRFDTTSETIHASLAATYADIGELDKSETALRSLITRNPRNADMLETLGDVYLQKREYIRAIEVWESASVIDPGRLVTRYKLIALYELQGKWEEMARHYEIILKEHQDQIMASVKLGALYLKLKDYSRAIDVYRKALQYDPNNLYILEALASSYIIKQDYAQSLKVFEEILSLKPDDRLVHHRIASLALQLGDYEKSLRHYRIIENESRNQHDVQRGIGFALYQLKRASESVPFFEKAAQLNERDVLSLTLLAAILQDKKEFERSDMYFEKALRIEPENDMILNNYSYSLAERGVQLEKALKMIKRVMTRSPDNSHYLDTYGWVLYRLGQYEQALYYIRKSYEIDSTSWEVTLHMGEAHEKLNNPGKALYYYERAHAQNGSNEAIKQKIETLRKDRRNDE